MEERKQLPVATNIGAAQITQSEVSLDSAAVAPVREAMRLRNLADTRAVDEFMGRDT